MCQVPSVLRIIKYDYYEVNNPAANNGTSSLKRGKAVGYVTQASPNVYAKTHTWLVACGNRYIIRHI